MLAGKYLTLFNRLSGTIDPKRMFHDPLHTLAFGTDASFYRLIPKLVIKAKNDEEVSLILSETEPSGTSRNFQGCRYKLIRSGNFGFGFSHCRGVLEKL